MRDLKDLDLPVVVAILVGIDADHDPVVRLHLLSEAVARLGDRAAEVAAVNALDDAAHVVDRLDDLVGVGFKLIRQRLHIPAAPKRVDGPVHAGFVGQDLLGA